MTPNENIELIGATLIVDTNHMYIDDEQHQLSDLDTTSTSSGTSCSTICSTISGNDTIETKNCILIDDTINNENFCKQQIVNIPKANRSRQLFGIQLEVTSLLLEAERRKLAVLQSELQIALEEDFNSVFNSDNNNNNNININNNNNNNNYYNNNHKEKQQYQQQQKLILAIERIQTQYDLLNKEYELHAIGVLRCSNIRGLGKSNRSQPAMGIKHTSKARPTIFGTVASDQCPKDNSSRRSLPQTPQCSKNTGKSSQANVDLKDILRSDENALVYRDGNLISGPLEALIQHMVPTSDYYPDRSYLFAFLLSARLFIKPHELLSKIGELCDIQQHLTDKDLNDYKDPCLLRFTTNFVQLLAEWIETFPYDFRDERVMQHVRTMTQKCISINEDLRKEVSNVLQNLLHCLTALEHYEDFLERINATVEATSDLDHPLSPSASSSVNSTGSRVSSSSTSVIDIFELCPNPMLLAYQLTHIELERLSHIGPEEFVQAFAKESPHLETCFKDMKKTKNLESYVQWFNKLSYLVATEIVKHPKKKQRVRIVEYWIEAARESFNIGNFNSLMAIIAGLNMSPISRLKKTWAKVQSAKFAILEHQMDPTSNFSSYRSTLKAAMWRSAGATDERQRIVIPFFSLLVKDLYFLNEGCSNKLPNGHINFEKFWQLAKQVTEFIAWKQVTCPFEKNIKVITYLQTYEVLSENTLAMASFDCEPPDNNHEKDRYKTLKNEQSSKE